MPAELPPVTLSGSASASARLTLSTTRCVWQNREKQARGNVGLKIVPFGATTSTGRKTPSFWGTCSGKVTSSSRIGGTGEWHETSSDPSNGTLYPVGTSGCDPVRSIVIESSSTITRV